MNRQKIAILGGDSRFAVLAEQLCQNGYECAVWGVPTDDLCESVRCVDWYGAVREAGAVILPLPATVDGTRLNAPLAKGKPPLLTEIFENLSESALLLMGNPPQSVTEAAKSRNIDSVDYFVSEVFETKNALPTAEGALYVAMENMERTVNGASFAVIGYGRIGKLLCDILKKLGGEITVYARKEEARALAEIHGCHSRKISDLFSDARYDVVFNTVPTDVVSVSADRVSAPTVLIDLAPKSWISSSDAVRESCLRVIDAPSLPGRFFPITAGKILAECIIGVLRERGI